MNGVEIVHENGKTVVKSNFDRQYEPVVLTPEESIAVSIVCECLSHLHCKIHLERRTANYLSIIANDSYDFCRIKIGTRSTWFSVFMPRIQAEFVNDSRLSGVKNKNQFHWKINLNRIDELKQYTDIIQKSCQSILQ